jgi:acyl-CoA thioesterase
MHDELKITDAQKKTAAAFLAANKVAQLIGMELIDMSDGEATIGLRMRDELRQPHGLLHGGITATLIDTAMAFAVVTKLGKGESSTTVNLTIHYLRPHTEGAVMCTARVLRAGRKIITVSAEAFNEEKKVIATAISTYTRV